MRFPVSKVLDLVASGMTTAAILRNYPYLEEEDLRQALKYAAAMKDDDAFFGILNGNGLRSSIAVTLAGKG